MSDKINLTRKQRLQEQLTNIISKQMETDKLITGFKSALDSYAGVVEPEVRSNHLLDRSGLDILLGNNAYYSTLDAEDLAHSGVGGLYTYRD